MLIGYMRGSKADGSEVLSQSYKALLLVSSVGSPVHIATKFAVSNMFHRINPPILIA